MFTAILLAERSTMQRQTAGLRHARSVDLKSHSKKCRLKELFDVSNLLFLCSYAFLKLVHQLNCSGTCLQCVCLFI